ncbi:hypothetical protein HYQ46_000834 [Verticillium longisporum]|nr:hypothetical protein HYQ46_000834 [Verticillium longisporum]
MDRRRRSKCIVLLPGVAVAAGAGAGAAAAAAVKAVSVVCHVKYLGWPRQSISSVGLETPLTPLDLYPHLPC